MRCDSAAPMFPQSCICPQRLAHHTEHLLAPHINSVVRVHAAPTEPAAEKKPYAALRELFPDGTGPDVCIEAVGLHYTNSWLHWFEVRVGAGGACGHIGAAAVSLPWLTADIHRAARCGLLEWQPGAPDAHSCCGASSVTVTYRPL